MTQNTSPALQHPITEDDIANYLVHTPDFFARHAELLGAVQLNSPHGNRAVSLQERQAEMLRDKIKGLEQRIMEMVRHGNDNVLLSDKLLAWTRRLFLIDAPIELPAKIATEITHQFMVPQVAIKVWDVDIAFRNADFAKGVSEDARLFANSLSEPFCGLNTGFESVSWLPDAPAAVSIALLPLRSSVAGSHDATGAFGMIVLASPDGQRFNADMGTDFLERIGDVASAALSRLR